MERFKIDTKSLRSKYVDKQAFSAFSTMHFSRTKAKNEYSEVEVFKLCHGTVVSGHIIELSAAFWIASIAGGGGGGTGSKDFCVENTILVEVEMLIKDVMSYLSKSPSLDRMSSCTPFVNGGEGIVSKLAGCGRRSFIVFMGFLDKSCLLSARDILFVS